VTAVIPQVVTCARGVERAVKHELKELGVEKSISGKGAVLYDAPLETLAKVNVFSRTGSKALWVIGRFKAQSEKEIVRQLAELPFEEHIERKTTIAVEAHLIEAPWDHGLFAAQRTKDVIVDRMRDRKRFRPEIDPKKPAMRFVLHWDRDDVTVSIDTTGMPLHRRGYRMDGHIAPLRENLAAALLALGWADVRRPFIDPFCGSGTLAIEQALRGMKRAPGGDRRFAIDRWKHAPRALKDALFEAREQAKADAIDAPPAPIFASDIDDEALESLRANAHRAGVLEHLVVEKRDVFDAALPEDGVMCSNLPYGERLGNDKEVRELHRALGDYLREAGGGRRILLLTAYRDAEALLDLGKPTKRWSLYNGALRTMLRRWDLPE
jgi:23S rRNA G2445 N2-methylase RlmL